MIHFVSQEQLGAFIKMVMEPEWADEDENETPTWHELAGRIISFTRDQEQAHRDLQLLLRQRGDMERKFKSNVAEMARQEECLRARIVTDGNQSEDNAD
jgi:hypothetical protein